VTARLTAARMACALALLMTAAPCLAAGEVPRVVLALYEGDEFDDPAMTPTHRLAELPLNHLGLVLRYHDVRQPLPPVSSLGDVRGVLTWFQSEEVFADPVRYGRWAQAVVAAGKRLVVLGSAGISRDRQGRVTAWPEVRAFFERLGIDYVGGWVSATYDYECVARDPDVVEFERKWPTVLPSFTELRAVAGRSVAHASLRRRGDTTHESHPVITSVTGGYVAPGYTHYASEAGGRERRQWFVNPFEFFRLALATDDLPKPDPTTVSGRRIFYSHIDGDGWRNLTEIEPHRKHRLSSARVVLIEIIDKFPDLPVTVGPVLADLDPAWHGTEESRASAREIFSRSHVEVSSHTFSHPLDWRFFERYDRTRESAYGREGHRLRAHSDVVGNRKGGYRRPRSYVDHPFDLRQEVAGSLEALAPLLPKGKRVELYQWSGDTLPFPQAVAAVRQAGLRAINGGDTRFDRDFPSYAWVAPVGRPVGQDWQVYSSNSNENTYTDLWTDRFFGFTFLVRTIRNTELPLRVKPFNVYYHMYSGEKLAALNAVRRNLEYARTQQIAPITTSRYAAIAEGFFSARLRSLGPRHWRVTNRGALNTVRFDRASRLTVDFERSPGVVGARHLYGALYVTLDEQVNAPEIALRDLRPQERFGRHDRPLLVHARWRVWQVRPVPGGVQFTAQGFGPGEFEWQMPGRARVRVQVHGSDAAPVEAAAGPDGILGFRLDTSAIEPVTITMTIAGGTS
jgi:polysaccharide biosynthesis protein PelA